MSSTEKLWVVLLWLSFLFSNPLKCSFFRFLFHPLFFLKKLLVNVQIWLNATFETGCTRSLGRRHRRLRRLSHSLPFGQWVVCDQYLPESVADYAGVNGSTFVRWQFPRNQHRAIVREVDLARMQPPPRKVSCSSDEAECCPWRLHIVRAPAPLATRVFVLIFIFLSLFGNRHFKTFSKSKFKLNFLKINAFLVLLYFFVNLRYFSFVNFPRANFFVLAHHLPISSLSDLSPFVVEFLLENVLLVSLICHSNPLITFAIWRRITFFVSFNLNSI